MCENQPETWLIAKQFAFENNPALANETGAMNGFTFLRCSRK